MLILMQKKSTLQNAFANEAFETLLHALDKFISINFGFELHKNGQFM